MGKPRKARRSRKAVNPRRQIGLCPVPGKSAYANEYLARQAASFVARAVIADGLEFVPCYGYRCACGAWHLTMQETSGDGREHVLLKSVPAELQAWARGDTEPAEGSWRVMDDDDIERLVL